MQFWIYLVFGVLLSAYVLLWVHLRRARALLDHLPSYPQLPILGNLWQVAGDGKSLFKLLKHVSSKAEETMKPFLVWLGPLPYIVITDPEDVKTVTNTFIEKPYFYSFAKIWLGNGLVTAPGYLWKQNVKRFANMFNTSVVESYQTVFNAQALKLVENLKKETGKGKVDIMHLLADTTLQTICQTAFGTARIYESIVTREYYDAINQCLALLTRRGLNLWLHPDCLYRCTSDYRMMKRHVSVAQNVSHTILEKRKLRREKIEGFGSANSNREKGKEFKAVLDILLDLAESDPQYSEKQIKHDVDTFIFGGQETTATLLFYALLMIGSKSMVQEKLYREFESIFAGSVRPVEKEDLSKMQYCEATILETLRLFPPIPGVMRYADRELQLKSCRVPKGTGCCINIWGAGRSKRIWGPDSLEFDPDRWLDGRASSTAASFIPFSYGRRACIGRKYAMAIEKTFLAHCVRELRFSSEADKLELKVEVTLKPVSGHLMEIELRK